ncbi:hypothetical protein ADT71_01040 [Novosphingobium sp. ST904]|nr:hypothetical protein ADT71_01040 [Novosphingobium sp. ST904]TCM23035.1 hypothetical protein EDF59_1607 [Novosphingobium sp. ST904]
MKVDRSSRADVRNPVVALASAEALRQLDRAAREALRLVLVDLAADARLRAEKCWRTHKAPMAVYWKCVAVYAGHTARFLRRGA